MSSTPRRIEILAPVGSPACLEAAVWAGADSVYLGLQGFNARQGAGNFTPDELKEAVRFCHANGVAVHVTLNTLLHADELPAVQQSIADICAAGADAVLVQDWATAALVRQCAPGLKLHASTQMAVCDVAGAKLAAEYGFDRVVLARELSGPEIARITAACGIETEAFIHGAQCMSVSGQCYLSAFLGGRSGNRGGCAQPCRLPHTAFLGTQPPKNASGHHLSLKDMSALAYLPQLEAMGVASVKIEGRLRPPEYVASAVHAARLARDGKPYDAALLEQVFSRSGFTDGYFTGSRTGQMFGMRKAEDLAVSRAAEPGIRQLYRRPLERVPVRMELFLEEDGARLTVSDGAQRAVAYAEGDTSAQAPGPTFADAARRSLAKTGGTPFAVSEADIAVHGADSYYLPLGQINTLRRTALDTLYQKRADAHRVSFTPAADAPAPRQLPPLPEFDGKRLLVGRFETPRQLPNGLDKLYYRLVFPLRSAEQIPQNLRAKTVLEIPRGNFGGTDALQRSLEKAAGLGYTRFEANNIGHLQLLRGLKLPDGEKVEIWGGFALNVLNPAAARQLADLGVHTQVLSCEVRTDEIAAFAGAGVYTSLLAYGRLPVMLTRACPLHNITDCDSCPKRGRLLDRKGEALPVICRGSVREIFNPVPLWMGERQDEAPTDLLTLYFTWEDAARVRAVTEMFRAGQPFDARFTRGLYYAARGGK